MKSIWLTVLLSLIGCQREPRYAEAHIEVGSHDELHGIVVYADGTTKELP